MSPLALGPRQTHNVVARWLVLAAAAGIPILGAACVPHGGKGAAEHPANGAQAGGAAGGASSQRPPLPPVDPALAAQTDDIVARHIAALGGLDKLHAITSLRLTGHARFGVDSPLEADFDTVQKRPGSARIEVSFQGMTGVDAYDGSEAWSTSPWDGRRDPFKQSADEAKDLAHFADIDGPLVDWRAKGHRVEYMGTEEIDGTQAHKLRVILKDGDVQYKYLDPDAMLEIRTVTETWVRGAQRVHVTDYSDYEQVAGVWMAFESASGRKGGPRREHIRIDRAELNVDLPDDMFHMPPASARVSRAILAGPGAVPPAPAAPPTTASKTAPALDGGAISGLGARNIGSAAMSGRVAAVAAYDEDGKTIVYVGAASGGVWKSLDGGTTFKPVFDEQSVQSIGAITIDPTSPQTVWVGTGESWTRNSVSIGDGIYKSTDAGATWTRMGLPESERIVRILVHPKNGSVVYACVPGKLWSDSANRGVYKTEDGGKNWSLVLQGGNLSTGCSGLSMDPKDPDVLFAGMWDFRRKGWTYRSGGETPDAPSASGLFRTADGGKTWTPLTATATSGLPQGPWGRLEVVVAPSDAKVVYALIESKDSALYRSADGGATWERRDKSQNMVWRPFYFARLVVDPTNADRLFKPDLGLIASDDGGRSFSPSGGDSHGDWHDLWIDPANPKHVIGGDDGGLWISWDGGSRWWKADNLPVSQFYHVSVDAKDPYQVYGGLQDNSSWVGDSSYPGGITSQRWENLYDGDGFWVIVDPTDPDAVYAESQGGFIGRVDRRTHTARDIQPKAKYKEKLRFNWNTPIASSPTQKGTIYIGAQFLFRSRDRGDTWDRVSPDLTTNDPEKQKQEQSGGVTVDNSSAEMHTTIYSISESPKDPTVVWVGTDDGNVQVTRDGCVNWTNVVKNVPGLPPSSWVSWVEASRFDPATAYAAFDRHTFGDMTAWVYKTTDYGKTWKRIASPEQGLRGWAHVVKEDVVSPNLLFVGTEMGLWISVDGGGKWAEFKGGEFPSVAVRDLQVHPRENDLIIGTHGRGIWIVDDISPLRALTSDVMAKDAVLLSGRPVQQRMHARGGWANGDAAFVGQNPAGDAIITYYQSARHLFGRLELQIVDEKGAVVDTLPASTRRGINRVVWPMRMKAPRVPRGAQVVFSSTRGPRLPPGAYTVRLKKGAQVLETKLAVSLDRRAPYTVADRKADFDAAMRAHALFGDMSDLVVRIEGMRDAAGERLKAVAAGDDLAAKLRTLVDNLEEERRKIVATKEGGAITGEERIREHLDYVYGALTGWEGRPAKYQLERIDALKHELGDVAKEVDGIVTGQVKALDGELKSRNLEPIPTPGATPAGQSTEPVIQSKVPFADVAKCVVSRGEDCAATERAATDTR